jgi:hypothetical protein
MFVCLSAFPAITQRNIKIYSVLEESYPQHENLRNSLPVLNFKAVKGRSLLLQTIESVAYLFSSVLEVCP